MAIFIMPENAVLVPGFSPDVVLSESHDLSVTATSHPVERGSNMTDHVRQEPKTYSCSVFVSNTPIKPEGNLFLGSPTLGTRAGANIPIPIPPIMRPPSPGPLGLLEPKAPIVLLPAPLSFPVPFNAPRETYDYFEKLHKDAVLVTIFTHVHDYTSMLCMSAKPVQGPSDGRGATFALEFSQIRVADTLLVVAPLPLEPKGSPVKKAGNQSTEEQKGGLNALADNKSKLKQLVDSVDPAALLGKIGF